MRVQEQATISAAVAIGALLSLKKEVWIPLASSMLIDVDHYPVPLLWAPAFTPGDERRAGRLRRLFHFRFCALRKESISRSLCRLPTPYCLSGSRVHRSRGKSRSVSHVSACHTRHQLL